MRYLIALIVLFSSNAVLADQFVHGYNRKDGTYVAPYIRSTPDHNPYNNYGSRTNEFESSRRRDQSRQEIDNLIQKNNNALSPKGLDD